MAMSKMTPTDTGLLILRIGIGLMFMVFGWGKITGGPEKWEQLGQAMGSLGITFAPTFWGFMAAFTEFFGGLALFLGVFVRPFAALLCFTMVVAATMLIRSGATLVKYSHAVDMAIVFLAVVFIGGGKYALGRRIGPLHGKWFQ
jgi:putative oxidoreductase